jgi:ComF family protein
VHALKYGGWPELAPVLAGRMAELVRREGSVPGSALVVPVPTTRKRERERGYNQAELLARAFAERRELPFLDALERRSSARSQVSLHPDERRANVRSAFAVKGDAADRLRGARVLLIDDVLTTGATACEAAETLERGGATGVTVITFARALPDRRRREV